MFSFNPCDLGWKEGQNIDPCEHQRNQSTTQDLVFTSRSIFRPSETSLSQRVLRSSSWRVLAKSRETKIFLPWLRLKVRFRFRLWSSTLLQDTYISYTLLEGYIEFRISRSLLSMTPFREIHIPHTVSKVQVDTNITCTLFGVTSSRDTYIPHTVSKLKVVSELSCSLLGVTSLWDTYISHTFPKGILTPYGRRSL